MNIKRIKGLVAALSTPVLLFGCQNTATSVPVYELYANDFVELYDYKSVSISKDDLNVTQEEIDAVILFDLQSGGYFVDEKIRPVEYGDFVVMDITEESGGVSETQKDALIFIADDENLSDPEREFYDNIVSLIPGEKKNFSIVDFDESGKSIIVKYEAHILQIKTLISELTESVINEVYGYDSIEVAREIFKSQIIEGRILNIAKTTVLENSIIKNTPAQKEEYISEMKKVIKELSINESMTEDEYCYSTFEMTADEYYSDISSFFDEYLIMKSIFEIEGFEFSKADIQTVVAQIESGENLEAEEYSFYYGEVGIVYSLIMSNIKDLMIEYTMKNIE